MLSKKNPSLFGYRLRYYLVHPLDVIRGLWYDLLYTWQRARRGWATCDLWNADRYLASLISEMCTQIADHHYGIPSPFMNEEDGGDASYTAYLKELAEAFSLYERVMDIEAPYDLHEARAQYDACIERMRHLFDHFSTIND